MDIIIKLPKNRRYKPNEKINYVHEQEELTS